MMKYNEHNKKQYKHFSLTVTSELVGKKGGDWFSRPPWKNKIVSFW